MVKIGCSRKVFQRLYLLLILMESIVHEIQLLCSSSKLNSTLNQSNDTIFINKKTTESLKIQRKPVITLTISTWRWKSSHLLLSFITYCRTNFDDWKFDLFSIYSFSIWVRFVSLQESCIQVTFSFMGCVRIVQLSSKNHHWSARGWFLVTYLISIWCLQFQLFSGLCFLFFFWVFISFPSLDVKLLWIDFDLGYWKIIVIVRVCWSWFRVEDFVELEGSEENSWSQVRRR